MYSIQLSFSWNSSTIPIILVVKMQYSRTLEPDRINRHSFNQRSIKSTWFSCRKTTGGAVTELLSKCLYLTSTEFNKMPSLPSDTFSSLHINIRSLQKHFDYLSDFLLTLDRSFSVIAVSETWSHRSNSDLFKFPGYHFI